MHAHAILVHAAHANIMHVHFVHTHAVRSTFNYKNYNDIPAAAIVSSSLFRGLHKYAMQVLELASSKNL